MLLPVLIAIMVITYLLYEIVLDKDWFTSWIVDVLFNLILGYLIVKVGCLMAPTHRKIISQILLGLIAIFGVYSSAEIINTDLDPMNHFNSLAFLLGAIEAHIENYADAKKGKLSNWTK